MFHLSLSKIFIVLILSVCAAFAIGQAKPSAFESVIKKYRTSNVQMSVVKTNRIEIMDKETRFEGKIYLGKNKLRWDTQKPEKSLIVFDGKTLWTAQYPPEEFDAPVEVTKTELNKKNKEQVFFALFLSTKPLSTFFKVVNEETKKDLLLVDLKPQTTDVSIQNLSIKIDNKSKKILEINYDDEVGNKTKLDFSDIKIDLKLKADLFKFELPKGAQVTTY